MNFSLSNLFAKKQDVNLNSSDNSAKVALLDEQATSLIMRYITKIQDLDEVLKQAGVKRDRLRVLMYDDEIAQACETRSDAVAATPFRLEPSEGDPAMLLNEILAPHLTNAILGAWTARLFGYSVLEAVYMVREDGKIGLQFLGEKPFEWFEPKPDGRLMFRPDDGSGGTEGIELDQRFKFFLTRSRPTYRQPYGEALLSRLYWPWFFRQNGWKFWAKFLERFGSPMLVGKSSKPTEMVAALLTAHSQAVMGVDHKDSVEAVGVASGNNGQAFEAFEAAIIRRIQKVILGQTLTSGTDGGSGNRALGQVHDAVRTDKRNSDIALVQNTIQRVVDALCELNKWPKHAVVFADEVGLEQGRAARDKDLYQVGVRFQRGYFEDNYDLNQDDFELSDEAPDSKVAVDGTEPGDNQPKKKAKAGLKASQTHFFTKASNRTFTKSQNEVEDLADNAQNAAGLPMTELIKAAVLAATSPEDLEDRLFALIGKEVSREDFKLALEQSLYVADVLGYVHSQES